LAQNSREFLGTPGKRNEKLPPDFPGIPGNSQENFPRNPGNSFVLIGTKFPGILRNSWEKK